MNYHAERTAHEAARKRVRQLEDRVRNLESRMEYWRQNAIYYKRKAGDGGEKAAPIPDCYACKGTGVVQGFGTRPGQPCPCLDRDTSEESDDTPRHGGDFVGTGGPLPGEPGNPNPSFEQMENDTPPQQRDALEALDEIMPELEFGRGTHVQWRDYLQQNPDGEKRNPECGGADFHAKMVEVYDKRIAAIEKARHALTNPTVPEDNND